MKILVILRGLPGSGKSTMIKNEIPREFPNYPPNVCSADFYHIDKADGVYKYDKAKAGEAHKFCQDEADRLMQYDTPLVVIDNTNITYNEMGPYIVLAMKYGYHVSFREPKTAWAWDVEECAKRNVHGVSTEIISTMKARWQPTPHKLGTLSGLWLLTWDDGVTGPAEI